MSMHISPDPESGNGGVTRCPVEGCHQLLLVRDAKAHHDWHESQHEWETGVDAALDGGTRAVGLELEPWPAIPQTPEYTDAAAPADEGSHL